MRNLTRWLAVVVAVLVLGVIAARAQRLKESEYRIFSGQDVGFRVEGTDQSGKPIGRWLVRVDGRWVEPSEGATVHRVTE